MNTIGSRIAENRRRIGMTQEELAAKLAVSAQAVSKWENDITCPDVMTLPKLAELLGITVDELLSGKKQPQTLVLADEERKSVDDMMLKIIVNSHEGDKVVHVDRHDVQVVAVDVLVLEYKIRLVSETEFFQILGRYSATQYRSAHPPGAG